MTPAATASARSSRSIRIRPARSPPPSVAIDDAGDIVVSWKGTGSSVYVRVFNSSGAPITGDTLVTNLTVGVSRPAVAINAAGAFAVVWEGSGGADSDGIYARQFLANGIASGAAFLVNTTTAGSQTNPAAAMDSAGDLVVSWTDTGTLPSTIQAAYLSGDELAMAQFAAGAEANSNEDNSAVGIDSSGNFIIAWQTQFSGLDELRYHRPRL